MTIALKVEGLAKKYIIKHRQQERHVTLRDVLTNKAKSLFSFSEKKNQRRDGSQRNGSEEFWALRDINFEIKAGDKMGIIGRNGAGKSTLLKVLSRITDPTAGQICYNGKVASLLEVGTGFHPELTGRENIFLNGAILGMSREQIRRQFDEIVAFAEVERFLDTPVKRYSSGMYVRLAFAVAAHIETEILIVDEVLAVGDAKFQKKSLEKMNDISKSGRTLLFVSHNMGAINMLCDNVLILDRGQIAYMGDVDLGINEYMKLNSDLSEIDLGSYRNNLIKMTEVKFETADGKNANFFDINEGITLKLAYDVIEVVEDFTITAVLKSKSLNIFKSYAFDGEDFHSISLKPGSYLSILKIDKRFLKVGDYDIEFTFGTFSKDFFTFNFSFAVGSSTENTMFKGYREDREGGVIMQGQWLHAQANEV